MVIIVTISWSFKNSVSGRSYTTAVSTGRPSWSMPRTVWVRRGSSGSGRSRKSSMSNYVRPSGSGSSGSAARARPGAATAASAAGAGDDHVERLEQLLDAYLQGRGVLVQIGQRLRVPLGDRLVHGAPVGDQGGPGPVELRARRRGPCLELGQLRRARRAQLLKRAAGVGQPASRIVERAAQRRDLGVELAARGAAALEVSRQGLALPLQPQRKLGRLRLDGGDLAFDPLERRPAGLEALRHCLHAAVQVRQALRQGGEIALDLR